MYLFSTLGEMAVKNKNNNRFQRDRTIDYLRVIGTLLIILAHVSPPRLIGDIRTFDVTLLVFISGMSLKFSRYDGYAHYMLKRIKKLFVPTYVTITIILCMLALYSIKSQNFSLSWKYVLNSYLLIDSNSVGFVWIVKVYFFTALLTPMIIEVERKTNNSVLLFIILFAILIGVSWSIPFVDRCIFVKEYLIYAVQYSIIAMFGLRFCGNKRAGIVLFVIGLVVFAINQCIIGTFNPSAYKYPPHIYYLSYGLLVTLLLYYCLNRINIKRYDGQKIESVITWVSKNSFTVYICHIYIIWATFVIERVVHINWVVKYIVVLIGAFFLTYVLEFLKNKYKTKKGIGYE